MVGLHDADTEVMLEDPVTVKLDDAETAPDVSGLVTVTGKEPVMVRSLAGRVAVRLVGVTNVVESGEPLKFTTEPGTKLVPPRSSVRL